MLIRILLGIACVLGCASVRERPDPQVDFGQPSKSPGTPPIVRVDAVTDMRGDIGKGGFDTSITMGGTFYAPKLSDCGQQIVDAGRAWAARNHLGILKERIEPRRAVLHVGATSPPGFFEILYRTDGNGNTASVSMLYFDNDGNSLAPEQLKLESLGLSDLVKQLREGLTCGRSGS